VKFNVEDANCNACQNVGKPSTFNVAYFQKLNLYIKLQPRKPEDKNYVKLFNCPNKIPREVIEHHCITHQQNLTGNGMGLKINMNML
jgi:hypothetical protein